MLFTENNIYIVMIIACIYFAYLLVLLFYYLYLQPEGKLLKRGLIHCYIPNTWIVIGTYCYSVGVYWKDKSVHKWKCSWTHLVQKILILNFPKYFPVYNGCQNVHCLHQNNSLCLPQMSLARALKYHNPNVGHFSKSELFSPGE